MKVFINSTCSYNYSSNVKKFFAKFNDYFRKFTMQVYNSAESRFEYPFLHFTLILLFFQMMIVNQSWVSGLKRP